MELLRNSYKCFTMIASDKIRHFFATMEASFTMTWHILFGGSGHVSQVGKNADKVTPGVSELLCEKELVKILILNSGIQETDRSSADHEIRVNLTDFGKKS